MRTDPIDMAMLHGGGGDGGGTRCRRRAIIGAPLAAVLLVLLALALMSPGARAEKQEYDWQW